MKKSTIKFLAFGIIILMLLSIIQLPIMAATENETAVSKIILKKAKNAYMIYYKDICNAEFEFAFAASKDSEVATLNFTSSAKDQATSESLNIAYITENILTTYFVDSDVAYIWIRDVNDNILVEADEINLNNVLDDEMIELVDTTTKRITNIDTTQKHQTNAMIDGVDTTVTIGKVVIEPKENATYSYELIKVSDENAEAKQLFELAEKIQAGPTNTYESLSLTQQFYNLYTEIIPEDEEWTTVENNEILQPENTADGDKYVVWIKEEVKDETGKVDTTIDAKFLICEYEYDEGKDQVEEIITETVKLPVTFDSGTILFIALGIIVLALVIIMVIRVRKNKKDENK